MKDEPSNHKKSWRLRKGWSLLLSPLFISVAQDQNGTDFWKKLYSTGLDSGLWVEIPPVENFGCPKQGTDRK